MTADNTHIEPDYDREDRLGFPESYSAPAKASISSKESPKSFLSVSRRDYRQFGNGGALPSVVGGLIGCPVIAVPTSVGYGTAFNGVTALLGMLNSCAPGGTVVNIDNGFGAAFAAHRIFA